MNLKELREIIAIFERADISELDLEREGMRIKLKKGFSPEVAALSPFPERGAGETVVPVIPEEAEGGSSPDRGREQAEKDLVEISSPMVGTFYLTSSPEAKPFVEEGEEIGEGQVICIIEAMKLMNEIKSEVKGRVVRILVENGHPVEFGQELFMIESRP
ncbi:acetyl-CoA carboxylase biotin carboxyl carrier protein [candidate division NPL-UPA2 bacterium]|nr:acetyl-CoA carboxylase biotin carboxyl carrier protein [candidate division NPL-UPA2 bacterium]